MGRWSHLDTDEERLPEGMTRIGYDADTQTYTFRDTDGSLWKGAPGCQYGKLFRVRPPSPLESVTVDQPEGDEPEPVLNEGSWEPPHDDIPVRKDSLVKKFIKRLGSVRKARAEATAEDTLDDFLRRDSDAKADIDGDTKSPRENSAGPVQSPASDEKKEMEHRERSLSSGSVEKSAD